MLHPDMNHIKWKSGQVQRTKAFGMGIDELDICHVMLSQMEFQRVCFHGHISESR